MSESNIGNIYIIDIEDIPHWEYCEEMNEILWNNGKGIRANIPTTELKHK